MLMTRDPGSLAFRKLMAYTVLVLLSILCIVFFYIMFINATRAHADIQSGFSFLPGKSFGKNWSTLMSNDELPVWRGMFNSLAIAGCTAALSTYFSVLTAYAIHAYQFRLRNFAFTFILLVMMVPSQVSALGFVDMMRAWHWDNTFWPLILPSIAAPAVFFFMKQYMDSSLPLAIIEAARIDGSSEFGTFNRIVIHIMKPAIAVQAIFTFVSSWNNYFTPALLLNKKEMKTLPILIAQLRSADWLKFDMGQVYMMICLSILPVIVVYLCLSKFIIAGVAVGGVKE
ncbi:MAG: carbohydrate ABC transporter permease [Aristaeellaceae bacterium]